MKIRMDVIDKMGRLAFVGGSVARGVGERRERELEEVNGGSGGRVGSLKALRISNTFWGRSGSVD